MPAGRDAPLDVADDVVVLAVRVRQATGRGTRVRGEHPPGLCGALRVDPVGFEPESTVDRNRLERHVVECRPAPDLVPGERDDHRVVVHAVHPTGERGVRHVLSRRPAGPARVDPRALPVGVPGYERVTRLMAGARRAGHGVLAAPHDRLVPVVLVPDPPEHLVTGHEHGVTALLPPVDQRIPHRLRPVLVVPGRQEHACPVEQVDALLVQVHGGDVLHRVAVAFQEPDDGELTRPPVRLLHTAPGDHRPMV